MIVYTHPAMLAHMPPDGHPEHAGRLSAVLAGLAPLGLETREAPLASREAIERFHTPAHVEALEAAFPAEDCVALDPDTFLSPGSREAAYRAAGAVVAATDAVMAGESEHAFCAVRPPGHHAEPGRAMGFCLFNSIAISAAHALHAHGLARVAVVDFDVHHGNGTQAAAEREPRLFFASTHQAPLYPGTGLSHERGRHGNILNAPLPAGADGAAWRATMEGQVLPALAAFAPEFLFVSAGFDAHRDDPLAGLLLSEADYFWAGQALARAARGSGKGRIVSALEGGYDLAALSRAAPAFVEGLARGRAG